MQQPSKIFDHPQLGKITLRHSSRARQVSISVRGAECKLTLTIPPSCSESDALRILESKVDWIITAPERVRPRAASSEQQQPTSSEEEVMRYRALAIKYLPTRLRELAAKFGFKPNKISIRATHSRWGSCSTRNDISLSLFLMKLPPHLIDFVLIHELCHTAHHNHSVKFHELVNRCLGGRERECIREMKQYKPR